VISRRQARRQALFLLYQWDLSGAELGSQYAGEIDPWARALAEDAAAHAADLDERITAASESWTADRLGVVERSALRVAIRELDRGEVPAEVVINEAVEFAKRYSTEDAGRLVNGILGRIQREQEAAPARGVVGGELEQRAEVPAGPAPERE
jgi:N utilization substance protein B